jgi:excisionase family DNA binding protein
MAPSRVQLAPLDERQRYEVNEALAYLRTSRKSFYELVADGRIRTITEGRRRYVPGSEIARLSAAPPP